MRGFIILILPLALLVGCNRKPAGDKYLTIAEEALKNRLKAPSSYKRISAKFVYAGPSTSGKMGHVYRFEYDAQNAFGGLMRECQYLPFEDLGTSGYHNPSMPLTPCASESGRSQEEVGKAALDMNERFLP